jgi:hypothetical protein
MRKMAFALAFCWIATNILAAPQQSSEGQKQKPDDGMATCPMHDAHSPMNDRGEKAMGFSQTATTHHFFLKADGGVIQVEAKDTADKTNRDEIRMHLTHIAAAFAKGDFDIPMFVHDTVPPGEPEMKQLREKIQYSFEESPTGGRVVISSTDQDAIAAIHKFLRFQIEEHKTGDTTEVR